MQDRLPGHGARLNAPPPEAIFPERVSDWPRVARLLATYLDISALWSIGHAPHDTWPPAAGEGLLAFADPATLERLRREGHLDDTARLFIVVDGDRFESAWGRERLSGSLARWAWREVSELESYYEEARWAEAGRVVRVRRKALRLWPGPDVAGK